MTPYQFGQYIKQAVDMTSPEYLARMRAYTKQLRNQGVKSIHFADNGPAGFTASNITTAQPGPANQASPVPAPKRPASPPTPPVARPAAPVAKSAPVTARPAGNVIRQKSRSDF